MEIEPQQEPAGDWYKLCAASFVLAVMAGALAAFAGPSWPDAVLRDTVRRWIPSQNDAPARAVPFVGTGLLDEAYAAAAAAPKEIDKAAVLFVPHHLLAAELIAQALQAQASEAPRTVVLLSPNHFSAGGAPLLLSARDWQTPDGRVEADAKLIRRIDDALELAAVEEAPFEKEHGVYGVVPFIRRSFPESRLVPLIIKDAMPHADAVRVAAVLHDLLPADVLLVASLDFAHEQHNASAELHDRTALRVLQHLDTAGAGSVNIDSRSGLVAAMEFARLRGAERFELFANKNSVDYTGDENQTDVTSYITGAYVKGERRADSGATLLAFGDVMLNRDLRPQLQQRGNAWPFEPLRRFLSGTDLTLANLEGTITSQEPKRLEPEAILFTFDPSVAPSLSRLGFDLFSLANNHSRDFGAAGLHETTAALRGAGLGFFGDYYNTEEVSTVRDVRGMKVGFVGLHTVYGRDASPALEEVRRLRPQVDMLVAMPHWGIEYETSFSPSQQQLAHALVDAGADVVLGSHPHVVQPMEVYNGKPIFYSLGNFVFDQFFSPEVRRGLAVGIDVTTDEMELFLFPHSISFQFQVGLLQPQLAALFYQEFAERAVASETVKIDMADGRFVLPRL